MSTVDDGVAMGGGGGQLTSIELFAGAGGLALGLEQAGFGHLALVEFDRHACETLRANRPGWNVIEGDIHGVDFSPYAGAVDLVSGGFPCQAFSQAGKRQGLADPRGTLFAEFARCVDEVRPRAFLFENVRGLTTHDHGRTFEVIRATMEGLGYRLSWQVLDASRYGVGQRRERIFCVGVRDDLADAGMSFSFPEPDDHVTTLREALAGCPQSEGASYSERKRRVLDLVPPGGCWVDLPKDVMDDYVGGANRKGGGLRGMARRMEWDAPCLTLTTSPSQKVTERCHPDETRPFTIREYARIQSFPDDWEFMGGVGASYRQIGNAVPVKLARRVGEALAGMLSGDRGGDEDA